MAESAAAGGYPADIDQTLALLLSADYIAARDLATTVFLSLSMGRPLLLEGEAGVGKTEVAKSLAVALNRRLIRLQCYEGLDLASAAYEWNYPRQMLEIRLAQDAKSDDDVAARLYREEFLIERPLLAALRDHEEGPPVLLIDEIDRADEPFEAFLLEVLSEFQISIPELGTVRATDPPIVIITSNRTREVHDALRRRCLYHWLEYPDAEAELAIVSRRLPGIADELAGQLVAFVQALRGEDLFKRPGIAETLDWANALNELNAIALTPEVINDSLGSLLKYQDDIQRIRGGEVSRILAELQTAA